jgi:hypothetical protein
MNKKLLKRQLNNFYSCLATEDRAYENCHIYMKDLNNKSRLVEILYDLNDNCLVYENAQKLCRKVEKLLDRQKAVNVIGEIMIGIGMFAICGYAGSYYLDRISFAQTIVRIIMSLCTIGLGAILYKKGEN